MTPRTTTKTEKVLAITELGLAALLLVVWVVEFKVVFFPSADTHWESPGWALLGLVALTPLAISFGVAGWTLLRKGTWIFQAFPVVTIVAAVIFFWWADRGSLELLMLLTWLTAPAQVVMVGTLSSLLIIRGGFGRILRLRSALVLVATYISALALTVLLWALLPLSLSPPSALPETWPSLPPAFAPAWISCFVVGLAAWFVLRVGAAPPTREV